MRLYERFCGMRVVTYCVMSNHFHVLVEVPQRPTELRYFADGLALGTKIFVNEVFVARREHFGPKRTTGARALRGVEAKGLCALRDLRVRAVG